MKQEWKPIIYDTTLREGFQTPGGIGGSIDERVYAANLISKYANWVEIGMPANDVDFEIISKIKQSFNENQRNAGIAVLCRNSTYDINRAVDVILDYHSSLAHLFIGTSEEHRNNRFKGTWDEQKYSDNIGKMVEYAAEQNFTRIMFSPEDSYRTFAESRASFFMFVDSAIRGYNKGSQKSGRNEKLILNFPDTVGYSTISEFKSMISEIKSRYGDSIEISVHGHNDSGTSIQQAVEAYIDNDANWLQTTFGGLGERNGIASTEGVIAILDERELIEGNFSDLVPSTVAIVGALGKTVPSEAIVAGRRVNVSTAGIHTDLVMKDIMTYHINGNKYGAEPILEFGPTSGANQIIPVLEKIRIKKEKSEIVEFTNRIKFECNRNKRNFTETDIMYEAILFFGKMKCPLIIDDYTVITRKKKQPFTEIEGRYGGNEFREVHTENGIVETILGLAEKITGKGTMKMVYFKPEVIPVIPNEYLTWENGEFPAVPVGLDVHSDLRVRTGVKNGDGIVYYGFASSEDSFTTIIDSVIDAVVKMTTIQHWMGK